MAPIGERDERGGTLISMSRNPPTFAYCTKGSLYPPPLWAELPFDITANILHRLEAVEILETAQYVCKTWHSVCNDPSKWRRVIEIPKSSRQYADLQKMCHHAVDLSQGQLVDINLEYFASEELLDYIAKRSEKLRRLRLESCDRLSDHGLKKAIKRFPNLEEFLIILGSIFSPHISAETVETIGNSCPLLRSFALNKEPEYYFNTPICRPRCDEAYTIARSMPELRHLQLRGNNLTDEGLKAILDGCPHLESLDLDRCYHVQLKGDLMERCSSQIKCLRWKEYPLREILDCEIESINLNDFW